MVAQGVQRGRFGIAGDALAGFLRQNAGDSVTLIVVRETEETGAASEIAIHRAQWRPPTLVLTNGHPCIFDS